MPIDVEELVSKGKDVTTVRNKDAQNAVLAFLKKHKKSAFMQSEIGKELEMRPQQVRQICIALEKKGIAVRKQLEVATPKGSEQRIFWAIKP